MSEPKVGKVIAVIGDFANDHSSGDNLGGLLTFASLLNKGKGINCDSRGNGTGILLTNNDGAAPGSTNCNITNTIIPSNTTGISVDAASQTNFTSDYNDFHLNTNTGSWGGAAQNTLANWQSATGNDDTHSQVVNPDYVSTVYGGFVPQAAQVLVGANDGGPQGHTG